MNCKLSDLCDYAKDKIDVSLLDEHNYVSTENMKPNKGGITIATSLPPMAQTQAFCKGDVLVSNIRPYFKKIWFADFDGGCSNDVLVFRAKPGVSKEFLYYTLADDAFFDYSMSTSKGTKMPRGDKDAIMRYQVPKFDIGYQKKIACVLSILDKKITVNSRVINNLQQQTQSLYLLKCCLEPGSDLPEGWKRASLCDIAHISTSAFNPLKEPEQILEHYSIPAFDETGFPVFESSLEIKSNKYIVDKESLLISKLNPTTKRVWWPYCLTDRAVCSTEFIVFKANDKQNTVFLYAVINSDSFSTFMCTHVTGSTGSRQRTIPSDTLRFELDLPPDDVIGSFTTVAGPMYDQTKKLMIENNRLKTLRDSLIPNLLNCKINLEGVSVNS